MEQWTTSKQISAAMLVMAFASFPQILSVARSEWSQSLDIAIACFSIGIPLSTGYFLCGAKLEIPKGDWWRKMHDMGWIASVLITIAGVGAMFHHLGAHNATCFVFAVVLAILLIAAGAHADGEWGNGKR